MARLKKIKLNLSDLSEEELSAYNQFVEILRNNPSYDKCDFNRTEITLTYKYIPKINDIKERIFYAKKYISEKQREKEIYLREEVFTQDDLAIMLGVSRQTVITWEKKGFIYRVKSNYVRGEQVYSMKIILDTLEQIKSEYETNK